MHWHINLSFGSGLSDGHAMGTFSTLAIVQLLIVPDDVSNCPRYSSSVSNPKSRAERQSDLTDD